MDEYLTPQEWKQRALAAESNFAAAMDCLRLMAMRMDEPGRLVAEAAYLGCGGNAEALRPPDSAAAPQG